MTVNNHPFTNSRLNLGIHPSSRKYDSPPRNQTTDLFSIFAAVDAKQCNLNGNQRLQPDPCTPACSHPSIYLSYNLFNTWPVP